jgi:protein SCO1/2
VKLLFAQGLLVKVHWIFWLGLGLLLAACQPYQFKGTEYPADMSAENFTLTTTKGQPFRLSDERGKIVLMFFGFTSCPDVCPTTLAEAKRILEGLGDDGANVRFVFITVDAERDTQQRLGQHISAFHPDIIGLRGTPEGLQTVFDAYGIHVAKVPLEDSALGYTMEHTARVFLVDQTGRLRLSYAFGTPDEDILLDVQYLLD